MAPKPGNGNQFTKFLAMAIDLLWRALQSSPLRSLAGRERIIGEDRGVVLGKRYERI